MQKRETFNRIIQLILEDKHKGTEQLYNQYGKMVYITAKSFGCSDFQAESVVDKFLIKIWRSAKSLTDIKNPEGLIYTVAKNCAKDELNVKWHAELNENICISEDEFEKLCSKDSFEYLISPLKEKERLIMILRFSQGRSFQEIANNFRKPLPTITSSFYRALEKIKKFLKDKNFE